MNLIEIGLKNTIGIWSQEFRAIAYTCHHQWIWSSLKKFKCDKILPQDFCPENIGENLVSYIYLSARKKTDKVFLGPRS